jgi:hypothetical protein
MAGQRADLLGERAEGEAVRAGAIDVVCVAYAERPTRPRNDAIKWTRLAAPEPVAGITAGSASCAKGCH